MGHKNGAYALISSPVVSGMRGSPRPWPIAAIFVTWKVGCMAVRSTRCKWVKEINSKDSSGRNQGKNIQELDENKKDLKEIIKIVKNYNTPEIFFTSNK